MFGPAYDFLPNKHRGEGLLPWVIAVMIFLCALCLVLGVAIGRGLEGWSSNLATHMSVQIVEADQRIRARDTDEALRIVRATPGVISADVLAESETMALIKPWLGDIPAEADLPIPTMIDIKLQSTDTAVIASIKDKLQAGVTSARVDDHQEWMGRILDLADLARLLLSSTAALVILCTIAIVIFGCRTGLATHKKNIEIMHMIGAEDHIIARTFERKYWRHGFLGGLIGVAFASLGLYGLSVLASRLGEGLMNSIAPSDSDYYILLILPLVSSIITMVTAGSTVRSALKKMM
ncbi:hypothetical protein QGN29_06255 [Temperatibacter marinus]|uniref:ABC3 transporter permease C-terminal domain-containing protein n=1 Tax=Temperatibacter marinus TaxID=1456591 RepID=A0AA52EFW1_9PROT|nr:FtsX-like permease family protein [Temperatibacter marinus]WND03975.1 hypothetical protein QGN29_06255 [Temperatibacter marinus]